MKMYDRPEAFTFYTEDAEEFVSQILEKKRAAQLLLGMLVSRVMVKGEFKKVYGGISVLSYSEYTEVLAIGRTHLTVMLNGEPVKVVPRKCYEDERITVKFEF